MRCVCGVKSGRRRGECFVLGRCGGRWRGGRGSKAWRMNAFVTLGVRCEPWMRREGGEEGGGQGVGTMFSSGSRRVGWTGSGSTRRPVFAPISRRAQEGPGWVT